MPSIPIMPWGKHRGRPLHDIESSYLAWVLEEAEHVRPTLREAIRAELASRFTTSRPTSSEQRRPCRDATLAADIVSSGLHSLARKHHPDVGGNTRTMQLLNATAAWLKAA